MIGVSVNGGPDLVSRLVVRVGGNAGDAAVPRSPTGATHAAAFVDGYQIGLYTSAAVMTAGALLALITLRRHPAEAEPLVVAPEPA